MHQGTLSDLLNQINHLQKTSFIAHKLNFVVKLLNLIGKLILSNQSVVIYLLNLLNTPVLKQLHLYVLPNVLSKVF